MTAEIVWEVTYPSSRADPLAEEEDKHNASAQLSELREGEPPFERRGIEQQAEDGPKDHKPID